MNTGFLLAIDREGRAALYTNRTKNENAVWSWYTRNKNRSNTVHQLRTPVTRLSNFYPNNKFGKQKKEVFPFLVFQQLCVRKTENTTMFPLCGVPTS